MRNIASCIGISIVVLCGGCTSVIPLADREQALAAAQHAQILADQLLNERMTAIGPTTYILYSNKAIQNAPDRAFDQTRYLAEMDTKGVGASAFGVSRDGLVLTAAHVVESEFCSTTHCVLTTQTHDKAYLAKLLLSDRVRDVAILQILNPQGDLPFLELAPPKTFGNGTAVLTVGAPLGRPNITITGHINNVNYVDKEEGWGSKQRHIQFFALVQPGNSGGPLVSLSTGKVVGLITWITGTHVLGVVVPSGISQATPVEVLREILTPFMH